MDIERLSGLLSYKIDFCRGYSGCDFVRFLVIYIIFVAYLILSKFTNIFIMLYSCLPQWCMKVISGAML